MEESSRDVTFRQPVRGNDWHGHNLVQLTFRFWRHDTRNDVWRTCQLSGTKRTEKKREKDQTRWGCNLFPRTPQSCAKPETSSSSFLAAKWRGSYNSETLFKSSLKSCWFNSTLAPIESKWNSVLNESHLNSGQCDQISVGVMEFLARCNDIQMQFLASSFPCFLLATYFPFSPPFDANPQQFQRIESRW